MSCAIAVCESASPGVLDWWTEVGQSVEGCPGDHGEGTKSSQGCQATKAAAAKPPSKTPAPAPKVAKGAADKTSKAPAKTPAAAKKGKK